MEEKPKKLQPKKLKPNKIPMREISIKERQTTFHEVNSGYTLEMAIEEAQRCLFCKKPFCIQGCPVAIDIPGFLRKLVEKDLAGSFAILKESNPLPAVCGRVCPQETQCEEKCVVGRKGDPVAIGYLERFVGDWGIENNVKHEIEIPKLGRKVAIIGSGPAGLACAQDLAHAGLDVTIFEALHRAGGVLAYGIPPFRLARIVVAEEIETLKNLGVHFDFNKVIGKLFTIDQLMKEKDFEGVFIGTGAGLPKFMGIPGEYLNGVMSANEFLTRVNLMRGFERADTPVGLGQKVVVIGAGNTALDAARTALRMGSKEVTIVYRRTQVESPARVEELHHAIQEEIQFKWLTNPVRLIGDENAQVTAMECVQMELGEPDDSGRRRPVVIKGSEFMIEVDTVIYALGTMTNPIIASSTPDLKTNQWGYIEVDEETQMTSKPGVFAGGDIVTGAATVILAMGAGRSAATGMLKYLGIIKEEKEEEDNGLAMSKVPSTA